MRNELLMGISNNLLALLKTKKLEAIEVLKTEMY